MEIVVTGIPSMVRDCVTCPCRGYADHNSSTDITPNDATITWGYDMTRAERVRYREAMQLPAGKHCGDCTNFDRCKEVLGCTWEQRVECDFFPSKFHAARKSNGLEWAPLNSMQT